MLNRLKSLVPPAIKHTIVYGLSIALMKSISLIMLPITAFYLRPEQFGQLELLTSIGIVCSILVGLGMENTLFRYAATAPDTIQKKQCAANILILALLTGFIAATIGWLLAPKLITATSVDISVLQLRLVFVIISMEGAIAIPLAWFRMQERVKLFFFATSLRTFAQALLIIIFLRLNFEVTGVLSACLIAAGAQALVLTVMMLKEVGIWFKLNRTVHYLCYSLPIVGSGFIAFSLAGFDRWLLADMGSLTDVAIYGVAAKFALATVLLVQPFGMWWLPKRFAVLKQTQGADRAAHYIMIGIIVVMAIAVLVSFISPFLIHLLLPSDYHEAMQYVLWLILAMAFKEISELVNIGCFCGTSTYQQLIINIVCAAIGVSIMWAGISQWGIWAVVVALNLAYFSKAALFYIASQRNLPLPYDLLRITIAFALCLGLISISQFIPINWSGWLLSMGLLLAAMAATVKQDLFSLSKSFG